MSLIHLVSFEGLVQLVDDNHFYVRQSFRVAINWKVTLFQSIEFLFEHLVVSIDES